VPRNWDEHYSDAANLELNPSPLLVEAADLLLPGLALDLASGPGRHAIYLARLGWEVTAVDSSAVALAALEQRARGLPVKTVRADLERGEFAIASDTYGLICDFYYLQRDLFPQIRQGVRPGGVYAGAIHVRGGDGESAGSFCLNPGELRAEFEGWKILFYSEGAEPGKPRRSARILARRA
jgi:SAM-dependent methyltransferase